MVYYVDGKATNQVFIATGFKKAKSKAKVFNSILYGYRAYFLGLDYLAITMEENSMDKFKAIENRMWDRIYLTLGFAVLIMLGFIVWS